MDVPVPHESPDSAAAEEFYGGALDRIRRFMLVLMGFFAVLSWFRFGAPTVLGFVIGCAIAFLNFFCLKKVINAFADRATSQAASTASSGTVSRFLLRYFLMAVVAYAIFRFLPASLY